MNDVCYELSEINVSEDRCSSHFYSDDPLATLDGHVYAENCRELNGRRRTSSFQLLVSSCSGLETLPRRLRTRTGVSVDRRRGDVRLQSRLVSR